VLQSGKRLADYFGRLSDRRVRMAVEGARAELAEPAPGPEYPISWDSEKQRRAFFATDGFGKGIPYERTGAYTSGFRVARVDLRAYALVNATPYASYVGGQARGFGQSRIHRGRWPIVRDVVARWALQLLASVNDDLRRVIRGEGVGL
jgi:hypothetical protein